MSKLNTELFIARRISSREGGRKNVMVRIAGITVGLGMAVMIVTLAVITGFREAITDKLRGFGGDVEIVNLDGNNSLETVPITRNPLLEERLAGLEGFQRLEVFAVKGGIVKSDEAIQGVMLKGVDARYDLSFYRSALTEGELPRLSDSLRTKEIAISAALSRVIGAAAGDNVEMLFIGEGMAPRRDRFKISGIYNTGLEEIDKMLILTDIRNIQRLSRWEADQITGYEVYVRDLRDLERFTESVHQLLADPELDLGESLMAVSVTERHVALFDWLRAHNVNAAVILVIMLLVALLNMISALLIILLERTRMIGELKSLGMTGGALRRLFLYRSGFILMRGILWGYVVGIGLCLLQQQTHLVKLDQAGYFLTEVPVSLGVGWLLALGAGTFVVLVVLLVIPTTLISRITPDKTIRYQ